MNKIDQKFIDLKKQQQTALIPFISVGDPNIKTTIDIVRTLEEAGADIIELGRRAFNPNTPAVFIK